jgi:hypothetical protein
MNRFIIFAIALAITLVGPLQLEAFTEMSGRLPGMP